MTPPQVAIVATCIVADPAPPSPSTPCFLPLSLPALCCWSPR